MKDLKRLILIAQIAGAQQKSEKSVKSVVKKISVRS